MFIYNTSENRACVHIVITEYTKNIWIQKIYIYNIEYINIRAPTYTFTYSKKGRLAKNDQM